MVGGPASAFIAFLAPVMWSTLMKHTSETSKNGKPKVPAISSLNKIGGNRLSNRNGSASVDSKFPYYVKRRIKLNKNLHQFTLSDPSLSFLYVINAEISIISWGKQYNTH